MKLQRRAGPPAALSDERGQTAVEYMMILGLLTAVIIVLTKLIVPGVAWGVIKVVRHMAIYVSSV